MSDMSFCHMSFYSNVFLLYHTLFRSCYDCFFVLSYVMLLYYVISYRFCIVYLQFCLHISYIYLCVCTCRYKCMHMFVRNLLWRQPALRCNIYP